MPWSEPLEAAPLRPATTAGHRVRRFLDRRHRLCRLPERAAPYEPRWTTGNTPTSLMTQASFPSALQMESLMADWCQLAAPPLSRMFQMPSLSAWGQLECHKRTRDLQHRNVLTQFCLLFLVIPQPVSRTQVFAWPTFHSLGFLVMLTQLLPLLQTCRM